MPENNKQSNKAPSDKDAARALEVELRRQRQSNALEKRGKRDERELDILRDYHSASILQSQASFWVGLVTGIIAFAFILWTAFTLIQSGESTVSEAIKFVPEVVGLAFSTILLQQAKQARELMANFLDRLRTDRTVEDTLELARTIDDEEIRSKVKGLLALASKASKDLEDAKNSQASDVWTKLLENTEVLQIVLKPNATAPDHKTRNESQG